MLLYWLASRQRPPALDLAEKFLWHFECGNVRVAPPVFSPVPCPVPSLALPPARPPARPPYESNRRVPGGRRKEYLRLENLPGVER